LQQYGSKIALQSSARCVLQHNEVSFCSLAVADHTSSSCFSLSDGREVASGAS
jgi:hypothetical protein